MTAHVPLPLPGTAEGRSGGRSDNPKGATMEQPPNLEPGAANRLRHAVTDKCTESEIARKGVALRRAHPGWSDVQVRAAAMLKLADDDGIDW